MPKEPNARVRILESAMTLFQEQGFNQTGLNQILEHAKAPKGSLYHYFPLGKDQLACEVVDTAAQSVLSALDLANSQSTSGQELVSRLFDYFEQNLKTSNYTKGCPIATIALEQSALSENIRKACATAFEDWETQIVQGLSVYGITKVVATALLSSIEGAILISRTRRTTAPLKAAKSDWLLRLTNQSI